MIFTRCWHKLQPAGVVAYGTILTAQALDLQGSSRRRLDGEALIEVLLLRLHVQGGMEGEMRPVVRGLRLMGN